MEEFNIEEYAEFLVPVYDIKIPKKILKTLEYVSDERMKTIHPNRNVAVELCLYFLSMVYSAKYREVKFKQMNAKILSEIFRPPHYSEKTHSNTYRKIIEVLLEGTDNGPIIEERPNYKPGSHSRSYKITDKYLKGFNNYTIKTKYVKQIVKRRYYLQRSKTVENPITRSILESYSRVQLPTKEFLLNKGKELAKQGHTTNKGKKLTMRYRKEDSYWKDYKERSFVEDDIEMFRYYTENGFIMPIEGKEICPRIYSSLNMLPSWIRTEIKIMEEKINEADYSAMHPNLSKTIYNGKTKYITHDKVAIALNTTREQIKTEHLSFFNKHPKQMKKSILWDYYINNEPEMLQNILNDKDIDGYKKTAKRLFTLEVKLMTNVIETLKEIEIKNNMTIPIIYVFDCLEHIPQQTEIVNAVMNLEAYKLGIYTNTKQYTDIKECKKIVNKYLEEPNKYLEEDIIEETETKPEIKVDRWTKHKDKYINYLEAEIRRLKIKPYYSMFKTIRSPNEQSMYNDWVNKREQVAKILFDNQTVDINIGDLFAAIKEYDKINE